MPLKLLSQLTPSQALRGALSLVRAGILISAVILALNAGVTPSYWMIVVFYGLVSLLTNFDLPKVSEQQLITLGLLSDTLFLSFVLLTLDGVLSGWVSVLLFPAIVGSLSLRRYSAWFLAFIAMLCYAVLVNEYLSGHQHVNHHSMDMSSHMQGMLMTFCISVLALTGFISSQTSRLKRHQVALDELREKQWREQQILAFATLSANTTHQLASPISSIRLLLDEWREESDKEVVEDQVFFSQIDAQINRCENMLNGMIDLARDFDPNKQKAESIEDWITHLVNGWWVTRNEVEYHLEQSEELKSFRVRINDNVNFAIANILDNAANACKQAESPKVDIILTKTSNNLNIRIKDNGSAVNPDMAVSLGKKFIKSDSGLGIGVVLANAAIQQAGGMVCLEELAKGQGILVTLPLEPQIAI